VAMDRRRGTRDRQRRQRNLHNERGVHDTDEVIIDVAACRAMLARGEPKDDLERLLVLVSIRSGGGVVPFRKLKHMAHAAVLEAGSVKAAIETAARSR